MRPCCHCTLVHEATRHEPTGTEQRRMRYRIRGYGVEGATQSTLLGWSTRQPAYEASGAKQQLRMRVRVRGHRPTTSGGKKQPIPQWDSHCQDACKIKEHSDFAQIQNFTFTKTHVRLVHTINDSLALTTQYTTRQTP